MSLRDELLDSFRRFGDAGALSALLAAVPLELPPAIVRAERDRRLRILAGPLVARLSVYRTAVLLSELGSAAEAHRPPRLGVADASHPDVAAARNEISRMLTWLPARASGKRWPSKRHLIRLLSDKIAS